ncbi:type II toxin-antitoxin system PemK/MazF family toxin [Paenibacillus sp. PL2-23]|uniref:type II toxin-antitoxin system PemK/MazF family toxin n=1 Tax=Paenibacillus sp. PL2-23 TaxID=2100729 RepID=UPI0030FC929C
MKKKYKDKLLEVQGKNPKPKVKSDAESILMLRELIDRTNKVMLDYEVEYAMKWLNGLEKFIEDKEGRVNANWFQAHLSRGHIVEVELFGHFNKELTFVHPCVVLYDGSYTSGGGWMLVAPISTPRFGRGDSLTIDVNVEDGLKHESGVCLDNLKIIDKRRVLYQHENNDGSKSKLRSIKLDEIDNAILINFLPKAHEKYTALDSLYQQEKAAHDQTKQALEELKEKFEQLNKKEVTTN